MIDQQSGFVTPGRWGTTSLLVTSICFITLVRYLPKVHRQGGLPFLLSLSAILYGFLIGCITGKPNLQFFISLLGWIAPAAFSFHLYVNWQNYPYYRPAIQRTFLWGVLVMGAYGIFQYCVAPDWDRFYLENLNANSFGDPFPFEIRVFSSQSSPQDFANVMMAGLLLILLNEGQLRFVASGAGYIAFLLSAARAGWLGWCAGLLAFLPSLNMRFQLRLILTISLLVLLVVPLVNMEPFAETIQQRVESLSNGENDFSVDERKQGYEVLLPFALTELVGSGIGGQGMRSLPTTDIGGSDGSVLPMLFTLGWFGTLPYIAGILLMLYQLYQTKESRSDPLSSASRAIVVGVLAQVGFNFIFAGDAGMVLWGFLGTGMAANRYYLSQRMLRKNALLFHSSKLEPD
jgi:hypothetical protein